jgi:hypothetical protein
MAIVSLSTDLMRMFSVLKKLLIAPSRLMVLMLLCLLICVVTLRERYNSNRSSGYRGPSVEQVRTIFKRVDSVTPDSSAQSFLAWDTNGQCLGRIIDSSGLSPDYAGYGGIIPVRVTLDPNDNIITLQLGRNHETPSYLSYLKKHRFLERWYGLKAQKAVEQEVVAISGATMSCKAISKTLRHSLAIVYNIPLAADISAPEYHAEFSFKKLLLYMVMLGSFLSIIKPKFLKIHRRLLLLMAVIILGIMNGTLLSITQMYAWLVNGISFPEHLPLASLAGLALLVPILYKKNIYCLYLCSFGAAQELVGQTTGSKRSISKKIVNLLLACGSVLLGFIGIILLAGIDFDLSMVEPFTVFSMRAISFWVLLLAGLCLLVSVYYPRFWCRFLCPTGRIINLFRWGILLTRNKQQNGSSLTNRPAGHLLWRRTDVKRKE